SIGIPAPTVTADIILVSHNHYDHNSVKTVEKETSKIITDERKRTIGDIQIMGIPAFHDAAHGERRGTVILYKFISDDVTFCHLGDLGHQLTSAEIKTIGKVDVLLIPVGGLFTLDAAGANMVWEDIKPRVAIPMHYKTERCQWLKGTAEDFAKGKKHVVKLDSNEVEFSSSLLPEESEVLILKYSGQA
ncbi:MAG: Zn-dependent hydrolase, partial [Dehalococcoidia bacterium]